MNKNWSPICVALLFCVAGCEGDSDKKDLRLPTEYYVDPAQRFGGKESSGDYVRPNAAGEIRTTMHPLMAPLTLPGDKAVLTSHPYKPWAKKIWSRTKLEALWPGWAGRSDENLQAFQVKRNPDRVEVLIGWFSGEYDHQDLQRKIRDGEVQLYERHPELGLSEFKYPFRENPKINTKLRGSFYAVDDALYISPSKKPIVIRCFDGWWNGVEQNIKCDVKLSLPHSLWKPLYRSRIPGTGGVAVEYSFGKKYLKDWPEIHFFVLRDTIGSLSDALEITSNNGFNKDCQSFRFASGLPAC